MSLRNITYQDFTKKIKKLGYEKYREGKGSHEIWIHGITGREYILPKHQGPLSRLVIKNFFILEKLTIEQLSTI